jgi:hypothetical protein
MRSKNMQVLTDQVKKLRPDMVIYGIGDKKHQQEVSGHNEDDTPNVRAEDQDADNIPEHRALDFMLSDKFSETDANHLVADLVNEPENRARLLYVIHDGKEWSRSNGWEVKPYKGENPHTDHVHASGKATDDDNETPWQLPRLSSAKPSSSDEDTKSSDDKLVVDGVLGPKTIAKWQKVIGSHVVDGKISEDSLLVEKVQDRLRQTVDRHLVVDGDGNSFDTNVYRKTIAALQRYLGTPVDGIISTPKSLVIEALQRRLNQNRF